jgi:hypothetical protein
LIPGFFPDTGALAFVEHALPQDVVRAGLVAFAPLLQLGIWLSPGQDSFWAINPPRDLAGRPDQRESKFLEWFGLPVFESPELAPFMVGV